VLADAPPIHAAVIGRSVQHRPLRLVRIGPAAAPRRVLVVGCVHGTERAGLPITRALRHATPPPGTQLLVLDTANPDGCAHGTRANARGVDLNRNFPSQWRRSGRPGDPEYSGPRPLSEPETRLARTLIRREHPDVTLWFHQPQAVVRAWGHSIGDARRFARAAGAPFAAIRWPRGTAPNWQNHAFRDAASFVVELPAGRLSDAAARRYARAVLRETGPRPAGAGAR
jgi:protein MpaA